MTIGEQLRRMAKELESWAAGNGMAARVAGDVVQLIEMLRLRGGTGLAAVMFEAEEPRGEHWELGKVDRVYKIVLSRGRGFRLETGESLTEGAGGGRALCDLLEEAREVVRHLRFTEEPSPEDWEPVYRGSRTFEVQGFVLDAYEIRFALGAQLPGES